MELTHLQEVSDQLQRNASSPHHLPPASEQVIIDIKGFDVAATHWSLATPPSSPSLSLGSRKSSMCSISSLTSSSSGSYKSHPSPSGLPWHRTLPQVRFGVLKLFICTHVDKLPHENDMSETFIQPTLECLSWNNLRKFLFVFLIIMQHMLLHANCK